MIDSADLIVEKLAAARKELLIEYTMPHEKPWIIGFSGGKDSTLVLHLVIEMLLSIPPSQRKRPVHVLSNDTLVESPVLQAFIDRTLAQIQDAVPALRIPLIVQKTSPAPDSTFWVNLIGKGYPAPYRIFRWCTDRMKIRPTTAYIKEQISQSGESILLLGVRRSESQARSRVVKRYDNGTRLNRHNDMPDCLVFRPIVDFDTNEVWTVLMQLKAPWGGTHKELLSLYRSAQGGECPFIVDADQAASCGTQSSRFGCWTCTVVDKDKSIQGFIDSGHENLEPLAEFRDWLKEFSKCNSSRMTERRNGQDGMGPFTLNARKEILRKLLAIQAETHMSLISAEEIRMIETIWKDDESLIVKNRANRILTMMEH